MSMLSSFVESLMGTHVPRDLLESSSQHLGSVDGGDDNDEGHDGDGVEAIKGSGMLSSSIRCSRLEKELQMVKKYSRDIGEELFIELVTSRNVKMDIRQVEEEILVQVMRLSNVNDTERRSSEADAGPIREEFNYKHFQSNDTKKGEQIPLEELDNKYYYMSGANGEFELHVSIPRQICKHKDLIKVDTVKFSINPTSHFPFRPPYIQSLTKFCFPSIADGRGLASSILQSEWSPSVTFVNLVKALPHFIDSVVLSIQQPSARFASQIGTFPQYTFLERYISDPDFSVVPCQSFEVYEDSNSFQPKSVILTDNLMIACEVRGNPMATRLDSSSSARHSSGVSDSGRMWKVAVRKSIFLNEITHITPKADKQMLLVACNNSDKNVLSIVTLGDVFELYSIIQEHLTKLGGRVIHDEARGGIEVQKPLPSEMTTQ